MNARRKVAIYGTFVGHAAKAYAPMFGNRATVDRSRRDSSREHNIRVAVSASKNRFCISVLVHMSVAHTQQPQEKAPAANIWS